MVFEKKDEYVFTKVICRFYVSSQMPTVQKIVMRSYPVLDGVRS